MSIRVAAWDDLEIFSGFLVNYNKADADLINYYEIPDSKFPCFGYVFPCAYEIGDESGYLLNPICKKDKFVSTVAVVNSYIENKKPDFLMTYPTGEQILNIVGALENKDAHLSTRISELAWETIVIKNLNEIFNFEA